MPEYLSMSEILSSSMYPDQLLEPLKSEPICMSAAVAVKPNVVEPSFVPFT